MANHSTVEQSASSKNKIRGSRQLVLASRSPRRHQLLREAGYTFVAYTAETPEVLDKGLGLDRAILEIAKAKGLAIRNEISTIGNPLVLSSDTLVILGHEILGKPRDQEEAIHFLNKLSGKTHEVKTAIDFWDVEKNLHIGEVETSRVTFRQLSDVEILKYVQSGEPMDKAGAYGIQGGGGKFIERLDGNLDNVMGLSISLVKRIIAENAWDLK